MDSLRRHGKFFSYALLCYGYLVVRVLPIVCGGIVIFFGWSAVCECGIF